jgi:hypothetical protein
MNGWPGVSVVLVAVACWAGCDHEPLAEHASPPAPPSAAQPSSPPLWVDNPEFRHWSQFPVGTTVVREKEVTSDRGKVAVTTTLRLVEKRSDQIVVESQVRVVRDGELLPVNPPQALAYSARFPLPAGMDKAAFDLPSLRARHVGQEVQQVGDQEFLADKFTWQEVNETGPMEVTYWRHDQVPGRMLRQEIHGPNHRSVERVTQIVLASPQPAS